MKKLFMLFIAMSFACISFSQLTLIKNLGEVIDMDMGVVINTNEYFLINTSGNIVIYDDNFNISKTIYMNSSVSYDYFLSKNLFTNSGKYEYCAYSPSNQKFYIYDEDGNIIFDFGDYFPSYISGNNLFAYKSINYENYINYDYRVYRLGGWWSKIEENSKNSLTAYPNPASDYVNINYTVSKQEEIQIVDVNGRVIDNMVLDPAKAILRLDVSKYHSGIYFYDINGKTNKFVVR